MSVPRPALFSLTPAALWQWGRYGFIAGFAVGLSFILYLTWLAPDLLLFVPLVLVGAAALWYLFQHPLLNLCVVLAGFVLIADRQAGIQVAEGIYGLYYLTFLAHWFITRLLLYRAPIFNTPEDKALFAFLLLITLSFPLTLLFGGSLQSMFSEWIALSILAFYFPIKEACTRYRHGAKLLLLVVGWVGAFAALRNLNLYRQGLYLATHYTEVMGERVSANENLLLMSALFTLVLLIFARRWRSYLLLLLHFLLVLTGLIFSLSRGYWVAFLVGASVMLLLVSNRHRFRLITLGVLGTAGFVGFGLLFFGDYLLLILTGLAERFVSLKAAATADISLVNRFRETEAVWAYIVQNPVLGYGMGVPYLFDDLIYGVTLKNTFIHNGYISLWYKFGLWGLSLMLFVWACTFWRGIQAFRTPAASRWLRLCGLAAALCLVALTLAAVTSNPFHHKDSTYTFAVLMGLAGGSYQQAKRAQSAARPG